jgi:hypothetical protein
MTNILRVFPDYFASFPIWSDDGRDPVDLAEQLPLSADLVQRLHDWADDFNRRPHREETQVDDDRRDWEISFDARGMILAEEVRRELEGSYLVEYRRIYEG